MFDDWDIIVVGGGHAGCEAAHAAAKLGCKTLLITMNIDRMAQMSCNPAMGGVAKGQIVREIDALGGLSGEISDRSAIQFRMLNRSKGPAMWSPREQCDWMLFSQYWREALETEPKLSIRQDEVVKLHVEHSIVKGVVTRLGKTYRAQCVILTNGTFLNGQIFIGLNAYAGGRIGEAASFGLTEDLRLYGLETRRLKTGTPLRVDGRTIDFHKLDIQEGDDEMQGFSFVNPLVLPQQNPCYIAYTSETVHQILESGFNESPMFLGRIQGVGPRYCPSIEDKIKRFADKTHHQLFVEPETRNGYQYYINGFSSSLPEEIQDRALRAIVGFENAHVIRPGYAIEYDYFPPTQLKASLETKAIQNLFFAGQINGTTGYEEAAAQGLMAGINAARRCDAKDPIVLKRSEAYIGVLIDDLVHKGVDEPYRMFTSRAEFRILLRQDNADWRLTPIGYEIGLVSQLRHDRFRSKWSNVELICDKLKKTKLTPEQINPLLTRKETASVDQISTAHKILLRPQILLKDLIVEFPELMAGIGSKHSDDTLLQMELNTCIEAAEIALKYQSYIEKEKQMSEKLDKYETWCIPNDFIYSNLQSISMEAREKLARIQPQTIGQASRITGVSRSDIAILLLHLLK